MKTKKTILVSIANAIFQNVMARSFNVILVIAILFFTSTMQAQNYTNAIVKYRVTAVQKNNNQVVSISNEVEIVPAAVLYIPNAFTPNGDGLNDAFGGIGEGITEYNMQIFNRWGELIFESNDIKNQWDGNYHNAMSPMGVYVYKISAKGPSANGRYKNLISKTGDVTLVL